MFSTVTCLYTQEKNDKQKLYDYFCISGANCNPRAPLWQITAEEPGSLEEQLVVNHWISSFQLLEGRIQRQASRPSKSLRM
jgi:hypothetical protein